MDLPMELDLAIGIETVVNDPYLRHRGLRTAVGWSPVRRLWLSGAGMFSPIRGEFDWTPLTRGLTAHDGIAPQVARIGHQLLVLAEVEPVRTTRGAVRASLRAGLGGGVTGTRDELVLAQLEGDVSAITTEVELRPTWVWTTSIDVFGGPFGVRGRYAQTRYTEHFQELPTNQKPVWVGIDFVWRFGAHPARG